MTNGQWRTNSILYWYTTNIKGDAKISNQYLSKLPQENLQITVMQSVIIDGGNIEQIFYSGKWIFCLLGRKVISVELFANIIQYGR
jgi:hypothetical protein